MSKGGGRGYAEVGDPRFGTLVFTSPRATSPARFAKTHPPQTALGHWAFENVINNKVLAKWHFKNVVNDGILAGWPFANVVNHEVLAKWQFNKNGK